MNAISEGKILENWNDIGGKGAKYAILKTDGSYEFANGRVTPDGELVPDILGEPVPLGSKLATLAPEVFNNDSVKSLCERIFAAAMRSSEPLIFVSYAPHVDLIDIIVRESCTDFLSEPESWPERLLSTRVCLSHIDAQNELLAAIDTLSELGVNV